MRAVEGKQPRRQLLYGYAAVVAGVVLRERELLPAARQVDIHQPARERERRLGRVRESAADVRLYHKPVNYYLYIVLLVLFKLYLFREVIYRPVHTCANIAGLLRVLEHLDMLALFRAYHGREYLYLRPLRQLHYPVDYLVDRLLLYLLSALRAMRHTYARPEQTEIIVYLRDRADRGARVL